MLSNAELRLQPSGLVCIVEEVALFPNSQAQTEINSFLLSLRVFAKQKHYLYEYKYYDTELPWGAPDFSDEDKTL